MAQTVVEMDDVITPLRNIPRRPSSPSKSKSSGIRDMESPISASASNIHEKSTTPSDRMEEGKRTHSILSLFSRKHPPPTTLDNLPPKVPNKSKSESTPTPSGSLNFLQKLSFYTKHSPTAPSGPTGPSGDTKPVRPTELLFPVREMDSLVSEENTQFSDEHDSEPPLAMSPIGDDQWFEPAATETELESSFVNPNKLSNAQAEEAAREATIRDLEQFLIEFRSGNLRALTDRDLAAMRQMHSEQLDISVLQMHIHNKLMQIGDIEDDSAVDEEYEKLGTLLDHLHQSMEDFSLSKLVVNQSVSAGARAGSV